MLHVAFVRSVHAHARLRVIATRRAAAAPGVVHVGTGADDTFARRCLRAQSALPGYVVTDQPILAWPKARYAGEPLAVVVATDRYAAEDGAALVDVDYEALAATVEADAAVRDGAPLVHDTAPGNVLLSRRFEHGRVDLAMDGAVVVVERTFRTNRHTAAPMEGRGGVADWSSAEGKLTLWSGTQVPHLARHGLAEVLGLPEHAIRVIAPDVGGGFGVKGVLHPEDVALCLLAMRLGRPVKWVEQRREHFLACAHARDHHYTIRVGFDADGRLRSLDARALCNTGAYSVFPWTAAIEPLMVGGLLTGPYKLEHYRCEVSAVATNTAAAGPYRGVARPATTFVMERVLDLGARALNLDPVQIRRINLVAKADLPYTSPTRLVHDSGAYPVCFEKVVAALDYDTFRAEQAQLRSEGRYVGIGFANYNELTGLGRAASAGPRMPFRTGHEGATVRMDPSGAVTVLAGVTSQGQSTETTLAQVARVANLETNRLPPDVDPGLEATRFYDPIRGTFAAGSQGAIVEVDPATGTLMIRRWVCVEDTGRVINPMVVEGQVHGAIAQGIGGALFEHLVYDAEGQLTTGSFMDYALPAATMLPAFELDHIEEPADNLLGVRGVGEGGTLGPAAVLANAVADALGIETNELPLTPARLWEALRAPRRTA